MKLALGISGGVAVYKAAELVRRLQQEKLEVEVVMTRSAQEFVKPLTFAALTGKKVITEMFSSESGAPANVESAIEHIAVAQRIHLLVIAPATANLLAKLARGIADDFLTTLYLATTAPVVVAPAMNVHMWEHPATQENVGILRLRGVHVIEPDEGYLACGMTGPGRLAGVETIAQAVFELLGIRHDFDGETVLVTAGPTCEDLDAVRFLTNRSSGKMGYALADAAARRGARVILVSGPGALEPPADVELVRVRTTEEMHRAVLERLGEWTVLIKAAAVADYRPVNQLPKKIKRGAGRLTLELEPTADILADAARQKGDRILVGFAAETDHLAEHAREKLVAKGVDLIVANDVLEQGAGFDQDTNIVSLFSRAGHEVTLPRMSKFDVANRVLDEVLHLRHGLRRAPVERDAT
ncbi:MAG TPA: bifunctional phosphopantothenoylcysteine decarboxylase/phosphopantothenate--cysteine ligase CoaBC [Candidatus Acidoferrales bacterium]|nr:bifunctional phosphopantothenoylcysteine decarboxylase/phosphopantothenate--cysteine ligase CoaBC [Candidatus Acidoferrales bacterium]